MRTIAEIEATIAPLDAAVRPIAKSGFDFSKPGWLARWRNHATRQREHEPAWRPALDRAGVRDQADALISEIIDRYATALDDERVAIRALFRDVRTRCYIGLRPAFRSSGGHLRSR